MRETENQGLRNQKHQVKLPLYRINKALGNHIVEREMCPAKRRTVMSAHMHWTFMQ